MWKKSRWWHILSVENRTQRSSYGIHNNFATSILHLAAKTPNILVYKTSDLFDLRQRFYSMEETFKFVLYLFLFCLYSFYYRPFNQNTNSSMKWIKKYHFCLLLPIFVFCIQTAFSSRIRKWIKIINKWDLNLYTKFSKKKNIE